MKARTLFTTILTVSLLFVFFVSVSLAEELSQPVYKVIEEKNVMVEMRDGVRLATDIYRPDAEGKFPALLVRTPYNKTAQWTASAAPFFAARGYCVIIQDCRGTSASEGVFDAFQPEGPDGYDTSSGSEPVPGAAGKSGHLAPRISGSPSGCLRPLQARTLSLCAPK